MALRNSSGRCGAALGGGRLRGAELNARVTPKATVDVRAESGYHVTEVDLVVWAAHRSVEGSR